jgi:hypothetical protein
MTRKLFALAAILSAFAVAACQAETPPPAGGGNETAFYVGRWAADAGLCAGGAWVFTETTLNTAGEVSCTFNTITPTTTGYTIQATCTAEAPPAPATIHLSYAQSAQALLVEGGPFSPIGLIRCP